MGFVLGQAVASTLRVSEPWALIGLGLAGGVLLGVLAVVTNLPELVLIVVSAFAGASVAVAGLMLLVDAADLAEVTAVRVPLVDQPAVGGGPARARRRRRRRPAASCPMAAPGLGTPVLGRVVGTSPRSEPDIDEVCPRRRRPSSCPDRGEGPGMC